MFNNSSSSRTTRTYHYSSGGGPGGTSVTETRVTEGPDGKRSETRTYGGGGGAPGFGDMSSGFGDMSSGFGDMSIGFEHLGDRGGGGGGGHPAVAGGGGGGSGGRRTYITSSRSRPTQSSRYIKGWGQRKERQLAPMQLEGKTYDEIKAQCQAEGRLFEDPDFPAVDASIFYSRAPPRPFIWKRPHELCEDPQLFVDGASRFDVKQGELGDCWLLAAVASLCQHKDLLYRVVPREQSFRDGDYAGIFHFQFWQYGKWTDVIIDDRLPTYYDKLVFMHSADTNEFWTPLLEKAYAKLTGSYEALKGGATSEAMEDFTGGCTEEFLFTQGVPANMFQIMYKAHERNSLMGCSIEAKPGQMEAELSNGLIMGHAYSITSVKLVDITTSRMKGKIPMVRVRNPWGNECEWKGAWSDKSQEWKFISEQQRREIGLTFDDDGEFWMSFQDFSANFQKLEICNLGPDNIAHETGQKRWQSTCVEGSWRKRVNAGGCRNFLDTFWTNPQYRVEVTDIDDDDDENLGTLIVALMQKNRRKLRKEGQDLLTLGYAVYKVPEQLKSASTRPLDMRFFKYNPSVAKSPSFINLREVCGRHKLAPGHYCVIPSTFEQNHEGDFLLRIFSEKDNNSSEIDEETGMSDIQRKQTPFVPEPHFGLPSRMLGQHDNRPLNIPGYRPVVELKDDDDGREPPGPEAVEEGMRPVAPTGETTVVPVVSERLTTKYKPTAELTEDDVRQDRDMREAFKKIAGEDMEIDAYELQDILNAAFMKEFRFDGFSAETCRSMVAMMDMDRSGRLGYDEFKKLWDDLRLWKSVFKQFDKDKSGNFNSYELRQAFHASGFSVSNATFNALAQRYSHRDGRIYFDDYIHCTARLRTMFDIFKETDEARTGKAAFSLDQFIQTTMYS